MFIASIFPLALKAGVNRHRKVCLLLQFHHQNVKNAPVLPYSY